MYEAPKTPEQKESTNGGSTLKGSFGTIYTQFKRKAKEAIAFLLEKKEGEAVGALHHKEIGDIDLVWGEEGTGKSDGFGLAKLAKYHPEVLNNLQEILDDMHITFRSENRIQLESDTHQAAVRLTWDGKSKTWLLTAFEKKNSVSDNTTDTEGTADGGERNDTATPQNTVSAGKGTINSVNEQGKAQKSNAKGDVPTADNAAKEPVSLAEEYGRRAKENKSAADKWAKEQDKALLGKQMDANLDERPHL